MIFAILIFFFINFQNEFYSVWGAAVVLAYQPLGIKLAAIFNLTNHTYHNCESFSGNFFSGNIARVNYLPSVLSTTSFRREQNYI